MFLDIKTFLKKISFTSLIFTALVKVFLSKPCVDYFFYKQHFYEQRLAKLGKKSSKC